MTVDPSARDETIRELISEIAYALVDHPDAVTVEVLQDSDHRTIRLRVADSDVGKVIGKQGRTARSIRTILAAACMKSGWRYALDMPVSSSRERHPT